MDFGALPWLYSARGSVLYMLLNFARTSDKSLLHIGFRSREVGVCVQIVPRPVSAWIQAETGRGNGARQNPVG